MKAKSTLSTFQRISTSLTALLIDTEQISSGTLPELDQIRTERDIVS